MSGRSRSPSAHPSWSIVFYLGFSYRSQLNLMEPTPPRTPGQRPLFTPIMGCPMTLGHSGHQWGYVRTQSGPLRGDPP